MSYLKAIIAALFFLTTSTVSAEIVTDSAQIPDPIVIDFDGGPFTNGAGVGPLRINNDYGINIQVLGTPGESGLYSFSTLQTGRWGWDENGEWTNRTFIGMQSPDNPPESITVTFNDGPVAAVGVFTNYPPIYEDTYKIAALDKDMQVLEEYDLADWPIDTVGEINAPFRVGFEMLNTGFPSVARDDDGITAGVNFIDDQADGWVDSASKGLLGDWITKAVVTNQNLETSVLGYDNWNDVEFPVFQEGFSGGEIAAVRLVPSIACPCIVQGLRLMFGGTEGGAEVTLKIWEDGGALNPAAEVYSASMELTANDLALNAIDLSSAGIRVNGPFRVGVEFTTAGLPSVARDHDGTVPGRNFIYTDAATWVDATAEGVTGDWIIRASVIPNTLFLSGFE